MLRSNFLFLFSISTFENCPNFTFNCSMSKSWFSKTFYKFRRELPVIHWEEEWSHTASHSRPVALYRNFIIREIWVNFSNGLVRHLCVHCAFFSRQHQLAKMFSIFLLRGIFQRSITIQLVKSCEQSLAETESIRSCARSYRWAAMHLSDTHIIIFLHNGPLR